MVNAMTVTHDPGQVDVYNQRLTAFEQVKCVLPDLIVCGYSSESLMHLNSCLMFFYLLPNLVDIVGEKHHANFYFARNRNIQIFPSTQS